LGTSSITALTVLTIPLHANNSQTCNVQAAQPFRKEKEDDPPYLWVLERKYHVSPKVLSVGSFAVVKECIDKQSGELYALKRISLVGPRNCGSAHAALTDTRAQARSKCSLWSWTC
jgi:hypothetical protein